MSFNPQPKKGGWFPRFNRLGTQLMYQIDGERYQAQWITDSEPIWHNGSNLYINYGATEFPAFNEISAGANKWAGFRTDPPRIETSAGITLTNATNPAINPRGDYAFIFPYNSIDRKIIFNSSEIRRGPITDLRISNELIVWRENQQVYGAPTANPTNVQKYQVLNEEEFRPVPIDTPSAIWILSTTFRGFILRPAGSSVGYKFENGGNCYYPDAVYINGSIRIGFTDDRGNYFEGDQNLSDERVDLTQTEPPENPVTQPPNYQDFLQNIKNQLIQVGQDLTGANAGKIVWEFAWLKRSEGFGLLQKTTGNNFQGASTDILTYLQSDGSYILGDVIGDAGGGNNIQWGDFRLPSEEEKNRFIRVNQDPGFLNDSGGGGGNGGSGGGDTGDLQKQINELKAENARQQQEINELKGQSENTLHSGDNISIQSVSGPGHEKFMRYDWSDELAKFDRNNAGIGETYKIERK